MHIYGLYRKAGNCYTKRVIKYAYSKTIAVRAVEEMVKATANLQDGFTEYPEERYDIDAHIEEICNTILTKLDAAFLYVNSIPDGAGFCKRPQLKNCAAIYKDKARPPIYGAHLFSDRLSR